MRVAAVSYAYSKVLSWDHYQRKMSGLVEKIAKKGADLILLPEYAGSEVAIKHLDAYIELFQHLSQKHGLYICPGTMQTRYNRAYFFGPSGEYGFQDKMFLIPGEIAEITPGKELKIFHTKFGIIGIAICYDSEFPSLVRKLVEAGANLILVPALTHSKAGYFRVFLSCRARALENQCYVVQASLLESAEEGKAVGASGIYGPVDKGFPEDGIIAVGKINVPGAVMALVDFKRLEKVRKNGEVRNYKDGFSDCISKELRKVSC